MSDHPVDWQDKHPVENPSTKVDDDSAGGMLRAMREAAGVNVAVLASALKVTPQKLEALESNRFDRLPDVTFARGLAAAICRAFGADVGPVLERMPSAKSGFKPLQTGLNTPFRGAGEDPAPILDGFSSRPLMLIVSALLLGALVLWLWPTLPVQLGVSDSDGDSAHEVVERSAQAPSMPLPSTPSAGDRSDVADVSTDASSPTLMGPPLAASAQFSEPGSGDQRDAETMATTEGSGILSSIPMTSDTTTATESAASGVDMSKDEDIEDATAAESSDTANTGDASEAGDQPTQLLQLTATAESWVQVRDASGKVLISRTLEPGEKVAFDGERPLAVTLGRKGDVDVTVRGESWADHLAGKGTVARFNVD